MIKKLSVSDLSLLRLARGESISNDAMQSLRDKGLAVDKDNRRVLTAAGRKRAEGLADAESSLKQLFPAARTDASLAMQPKLSIRGVPRTK